MSRSYKRIYLSKNNDSHMKKIYNRKYRHKHKNNYDVPQNCAYKKENESWNISDFTSGYTSYQQFYKWNKDRMTEEELRSEWAKLASK